MVVLPKKSQYKEQVIPDYRGNPFIEALPEVFAPAEVVEKLAFYPTYNKDERPLDSHYRIYMIDRLFQIFSLFL